MPFPAPAPTLFRFEDGSGFFTRSFWDGSGMYGSDEHRAMPLKQAKDSVGQAVPRLENTNTSKFPTTLIWT